MQVIVVTQNAFINLFLSFIIYFFHLLTVHSVHSGFLKPVAATAATLVEWISKLIGLCFHPLFHQNFNADIKES